MIASASAPFLLVSLSQDAAQSAAHVGVDAPKDICFAVLEVPKPSSQGPAQILADRSHASTIRTPGLLANRLFEFVHAFLARPFHSALKMIAQKVEPSGYAGIDQSCFGRVQWICALDG